jgi:hypothetical protein
MGVDYITMLAGTSGTLFQVDSGSVRARNDIEATNGNLISRNRVAALSGGYIPFKIAIITDSTSLFTVSGGEWYFNGAATGIPASSRSISYSGHEYTLYDSEKGEYVGSGVYDTDVTRSGDTIYIEI